MQVAHRCCGIHEQHFGKVEKEWLSRIGIQGHGISERRRSSGPPGLQMRCQIDFACVLQERLQPQPTAGTSGRVRSLQGVKRIVVVRRRGWLGRPSPAPRTWLVLRNNLDEMINVDVRRRVVSD